MPYLNINKLSKINFANQKNPFNFESNLKFKLFLGNFEVFGIFVLEDFHQALKTEYNGIVHLNKHYKLNVNKIFEFYFKPICKCCGIKGKYVVIKKAPNDLPQINVYGLKKCSLVMITIDHIFPKSLGGINSSNNYQHLCSECNNIKSDKIIDINSLKRLKQFDLTFKSILPSKIYKKAFSQFSEQLENKRLLNFFEIKRPQIIILQPLYVSTVLKGIRYATIKRTKNAVPKQLSFWFTVDGQSICQDQGNNFYLIDRKFINFKGKK